jgi:hypothetical protein
MWTRHPCTACDFSGARIGTSRTQIVILTELTPKSGWIIAKGCCRDGKYLEKPLKQL